MRSRVESAYSRSLSPPTTQMTTPTTTPTTVHLMMLMTPTKQARSQQDSPAMIPRVSHHPKKILMMTPHVRNVVDERARRKNPNERIISRGSSDFVGVATIVRQRWDRMISLVRKKRSASVPQESNVSQERSPRADRRHQSASTLHSTTLARAKTNAQGSRTSLREAQSSKTKCFLDDSSARESTSPSPSGVGRRTRVSSTLGCEKFAFVRDAVLCNRSRF